MTIRHLLLILVVITTFHACKNVINEPEINALEGLTKLKEGYAYGSSAKVELWGKKNFFVGYNPLTVVVYDSLKPLQKITDAHIHFTPVITNGTGVLALEQASPVENPDETPVNGVFPGAISFIKASGINDSWKLGVSVHNHKYDKEGEIIFDITVDDITPSLINTFASITADNSKFVLSMVKPTNPKEGLNDIEFLLNKNANSLEWTTDDTYTVEINPEMLDMWYGSHISINTKNIGNGHYTSSFDFPMVGEWKVNVIVKKNGVPVSENLYFTLKI